MIPFFSIGITTYNRNDLLLECLHSIIQQDFSDIEVIIGNDYTNQIITEDDLGVYDPRIKIINYRNNLGPIENANTLISQSRGRYFTLLADDDMHSKNFLHAMYAALDKYDYPPCVFTSYTSDLQTVNDPHIKVDDIARALKIFTGRQFVKMYLSRTLKTISCYGVFDLDYIRRIGGMRQLGDGRSIYGELPLGILSGLLKQVAFIEHPLVFFRAHQESLSNANTSPKFYASSQEALFKEYMVLCQNENLRDDFHENLYLLLKWFIDDFVTVMHRSGSIDCKASIDYAVFYKHCTDSLKGSPYYWKAMELFIRRPTEEMWLVGKKIIKKAIYGDYARNLV